MKAGADDSFGPKTLHAALSGMRTVPQWFLWRLEWDAAQGKFKKTPCRLDGSAFAIDASQPANWHTYDRVCAALATLPNTGELRYALGFWLTADCGYWFFDLDKCATDGVLTERASQFVAAFPGALLEWSSSGKGLHIIGKGRVPPHRTRDMHGWHMEFYTEGRGIAFGLSGQARGSADSAHDAAISSLVAKYFPPRPEAEPMGEGARAEWRGPADDEELLRRIMASRPSANVVFGGKPSVQRLWAGDVDKSSENDMALAAHLAFWTGCDEDRMVRLMLRSGLKRAKWDEHRTYLRELTVRNAIAGCTDVYREPVRDNTATVQALYGQPSGGLVTVQQASKPISEEQAATYELMSRLITGCGTVPEMHNSVIPAIAASGLPPVLLSGLAGPINKQLTMLGADKIPVGQLRRLLSPPITSRSDAPLWVTTHCYVKSIDRFLDLETGAELSFQGFQAEFTRHMPLKASGQRENPVEWALSRWGMRTVQHIGYRPDKGPYFDWDGLDYANLYNANSVPIPATAYSQAGVAGINAFQTHMYDMCGRRSDVFYALLGWFAHNVKNPGRKIRWSPLLKGINGDGKTLLTNLLRSAMGYRNVSPTSNATLSNSGGFTDWAIRAAVNVIEEIWLDDPKDRHKIYNRTKEFITNDVVDINAKGKRNYATFNITNHIALTNHNDALPLEPTDRRWFIIFTPWHSLSDMMKYCGLTAESWKARTDAMDYAWQHCAGDLRAWFLSLQIAIDTDSSAMMTPEKQQMMATSRDDIEQLAFQILEEGGKGVTKSAFSSSCLTSLLRHKAAQENVDVPRTTGISRMFTRMGYSKFAKIVKFDGTTHQVWVQNGFTGDPVAEMRNSTTLLKTV